jgi:hypothetical protein
VSVTQAEKGRLQKKVARYVWQLRSEMWLDRWAIDILVTEYPGQSESNLASISPTNARYWAELEVATHAAETGGEKLRHTIVHELLHLWYRDPSDIFRLALPKELSHSACTLLWESYRQSFELMTDQMAGAWAKTLPLPDWGEGP